MPDAPQIARNATFFPSLAADDITPVDLLGIVVTTAAGTGALPGVELSCAADAASSMSVLRSTASSPRAVLWWQGLAPVDAANGVYDWEFNCDIQLPDLPQGIAIDTVDQGVFHRGLQVTVFQVEQYLRRLRFHSATIRPLGFTILKSSWIIDESALLGHRLPFSIRAAAAPNESLFLVDLSAGAQTNKHTNQ